ncbi:AbrB/MazE/SpoVT family DNA-binding domain-containing protein [Pseudactinotalea sp. Z1748]|uniref:AbrB/MazE/SpoVT family DNA-binding domain-containing protein n=1 Tax=Pseudactinotalea sp. Z1748 TaxID=3413027 RepID=UPI003C7BD5DE
MRTTIDGGGRVVIPKEIRSRLGLLPGHVLDIAIVDGRISLDVSGTGMHLAESGGVPVAVTDEPIEPLTTETVRATLEQVRR